MLFQAVIPPKLLADLPSEPLSSRLFCNVWLSILSAWVQNGAIIYPHSHTSDLDYLNALDTWPPKYKKRAQELLSVLKIKGRILGSPLAYLPAATCGDKSCQPYVGAGTANVNSFLFSSESCVVCPTLQPLAARVVEPTNYYISDLPRLTSAKSCFVLPNGQWQTHDFEKEVLNPLFRTAKHVKIYDRYIGRSIMNSRKTTVRGIKDGYKRTLEWIVSAFQTNGGATRSGVFEIYCGIDFTPSLSQKAQIRTEIANLKAALSSILGRTVDIFVKQELIHAQCPHGRYLITDQIAILIERGFELLWDDSEMIAAGHNPAVDPRRLKDVAIILCQDCGSVEAATKALPNF